MGVKASRVGGCPITTFLVTGGTGSIGSEIVRQLLKGPPCTIRVLSNDEWGLAELEKELGNKSLRYFFGDIRDLQRVKYAMRGVDVVIHAAALKHVPISFYNPAEYVKTNVDGTLNVITAAIECGVKRLVNISTDKAASPHNPMGASKMLAETIITAYGEFVKEPLMYSVRFGNVLNSRGSLLPIILEKIAKKEEIPLTHEGMTRFLMSIPQAANLVLESLDLAKAGETFILKMPKVKIVDLLQCICQHESYIGHITNIGLRPGEKLHEILMTPDEAQMCRETEKYYVLNTVEGKGVLFPSVLSSTGPFLTQDQILKLLDEVLP